MTRREQFSTAWTVELMKFRRAPVVTATSTLLLLGLFAICAALLYGIEHGDAQLISKAGPIAAAGGWSGLFAVASQIVPTAGMLAFGVVSSWMFGREFTDGTIVGLFARPVSRVAIALAKLVIVLIWVGIISACMVGLVLAVGATLTVGPIEPDVLGLAAKLGTVGVLTGILALTAGLAATWGRSYLIGIGTSIALVVVSVMGALIGFGGWFPFAAPGIWAVAPGSEIASGELLFQLLMVVPVGALVTALTLRAWHRLEL